MKQVDGTRYPSQTGSPLMWTNHTIHLFRDSLLRLVWILAHYYGHDAEYVERLAIVLSDFSSLTGIFDGTSATPITTIRNEHSLRW